MSLQTSYSILDVRPPRVVSAPAAKSPYIVSRWYDNLFFIFSPLLALALGILASFTPLAREKYTLYGRPESWVSIFSGAFTMAHLVIVFFRSHANPAIFRLYPKRFILVPFLLFGAMALSSWALVFIFVLAVWWDVYHSSLQTFGLGRLYDRRAGNLADTGRTLDRGLNLLLYAGPILAGASLMSHAVHFRKFEEVGTLFFSHIPAYTASHQKYLVWTVIGVGALYLFYYLLSYRRLVRKGYCVSPEKIWLLVSTGLCSIYTWGFNSFGQAFFIMNFFHALQYFALVWWAEERNIARFFHVDSFSWGKSAALLLFVTFAFIYGFWAKLFAEANHFSFAVLLVVSIMHFWYDGFIWSVRKGQV